jgi:hypothetical protein
MGETSPGDRALGACAIYAFVALMCALGARPIHGIASTTNDLPSLFWAVWAVLSLSHFAAWAIGASGLGHLLVFIGNLIFAAWLAPSAAALLDRGPTRVVREPVISRGAYEKQLARVGLTLHRYEVTVPRFESPEPNNDKRTLTLSEEEYASLPEKDAHVLVLSGDGWVRAVPEGALVPPPRSIEDYDALRAAWLARQAKAEAVRGQRLNAKLARLTAAMWARPVVVLECIDIADSRRDDDDAPERKRALLRSRALSRCTRVPLTVTDEITLSPVRMRACVGRAFDDPDDARAWLPSARACAPAAHLESFSAP